MLQRAGRVKTCRISRVYSPTARKEAVNFPSNLVVIIVGVRYYFEKFLGVFVAHSTLAPRWEQVSRLQ